MGFRGLSYAPWKRYTDAGRVEVRAVFYLTEYTRHVTRACEWPKNTAGFGFGCLHAKSWKRECSSHTKPFAVWTEHPWVASPTPCWGRPPGPSVGDTSTCVLL